MLVSVHRLADSASKDLGHCLVEGGPLRLGESWGMMHDSADAVGYLLLLGAGGASHDMDDHYEPTHQTIPEFAV